MGIIRAAESCRHRPLIIIIQRNDHLYKKAERKTMTTVQNSFARYKKQLVIMMTILVVLNW
ncbi:hypothetical protein SCIP_0970 [Scardovia inopinata JCM 12537]|nr:hypothetical protein SCIP_0970 [Scardovia inopinata JCM 12537]